jgi:hypothetical protein
MTYKYFFFLLLISYVNSFIVSYNYNKIKPLLLSKDKYTDYTNFLNKNKYDKGNIEYIYLNNNYDYNNIVKYIKKNINKKILIIFINNNKIINNFMDILK